MKTVLIFLFSFVVSLSGYTSSVEMPATSSVPPNPVPVMGGKTKLATPGQFGVSDTGQMSYSVPIDSVVGMGGISPSLSLVFSGKGGDGLFLPAEVSAAEAWGCW